MVAECKYALTGVGACIAPGNQKWKGNWADLVITANNINIKIKLYCGCDVIEIPCSIILLIS